VEFRILKRRGKKMKSRLTTLDLRRADFGLLRNLLSRIPWQTVLERRKVQISWWVFSSSEPKNGPSQ